MRPMIPGDTSTTSAMTMSNTTMPFFTGLPWEKNAR
jgi:hypothetical protein